MALNERLTGVSPLQHVLNDRKIDLAIARNSYPGNCAACWTRNWGHLDPEKEQ